MSKISKLRAKLFSRPKDFTWDELKKLLEHYGFETISGSGSRYKFVHQPTNTIISLHKPHPENQIKQYVINLVIEKLEAIEG